ncbi:lactate utilization protein C [Bacterioplanes sanyensis]|uniref:Lactate utilization protein C n=1 Tax=Bacterioplanes sanyensis TaxID=1249553 RepID=A0A222FMQ1_9GAMM|nr:LUD domain-containing protein [Bacterioplanes sanyensis]ASP39952.1 lactate utilization protein C [Bacterioplanes sanyensis]
MSQARQNILARLRHGQAQQSEPQNLAARRRRTVSVDEFVSHLSAAQADVIHCTESDWATRLLQRWSADAGLLACGRSQEGLQLCQAAADQGTAVTLYDERMSKARVFEQLDAGFSVACAGLTATGSLVVSTGPNEPRLLSLAPALSIVLVRRSALLADFADYVEQRAEQPLPSNLLLISGPSKTADIQQTLAYGAHGPKQLWVLLINDDVVSA